jgi:hypothetical protein
MGLPLLRIVVGIVVCGWLCLAVMLLQMDMNGDRGPMSFIDHNDADGNIK